MHCIFVLCLNDNWWFVYCFCFLIFASIVTFRSLSCTYLTLTCYFGPAVIDCNTIHPLCSSVKVRLPLPLACSSDAASVYLRVYLWEVRCNLPRSVLS